MLWLWILGGIALVFALFCLLRLGVLISAQGGPVCAWVSVGPFRIQVAPSRKPPKKKTEKKPKKQVEPRDLFQKLKTLPKPSKEELKSAGRELWPPVRRALERTRRGIRIDPLQISVTLGGQDDPAKTAELYGLLHAGVWTAMPALGQLVNIPRPAIHIGMDFDRCQMELRVRAGVSLRIGTLLSLGFGTTLPVLKWFLRYRNSHKQKPDERPRRTEPAAPAA